MARASKAGAKPTKRTPRKGARRAAWHQRLMLAETVLVVRLAEEILEDRLAIFSAIPGWLRVILLMLLFVGAFGSAWLLVQQLVASRLEQAHDVLQQLPVPTPRFLIHALLLTLLFLAYAYWYQPETNALPALWEALRARLPVR